jgi:tetratricopeptide (TPR) repeat protein
LVKRRRISKKPLDGTSEELIPTTSPALDFAQKYRVQLIVGVIIAVVSIAGFFGWGYEKNKKEEKAAVLYHQAYSVYQGWQQGDNTINESLKLFQSLAEDYAGTGSGMLGLFYVGNCHYEMGEFDDAIDAYERFLERVPVETQLALLAYDSLGYCYEAKKDYAKAIEYFQKTISPAPGLGESGYLNVARCYEIQDDTKNSLQLYEKFLAEFPESERAQEVREKIKKLNSET